MKKRRCDLKTDDRDVIDRDRVRAAVVSLATFGDRRASQRDSKYEKRVDVTDDGDGGRTTHILVLLRFGGFECPVDPLLHVEGVLGKRGDILKRPF